MTSHRINPKRRTAAIATPPTGQPPESLDTGTIYQGDNLEILARLQSASVDLIYIDPPFNSNRSHQAFCGKTKEKRAFDDRHESTGAYIEFMRPRCVELARVLKKTGSLYYHCDWHASHYVKVMLDGILGEDSFINEIVWVYETGGRATHHFHRKHDVLFLYSPRAGKKNFTFNGKAIALPRNKCDACGTTLEKWNNLKKHVDENKRIYRTINSGGKTYKYYDDELVTPSDVWHISHLQQKDPQRLGYPTQKPIELLKRIIKVSSNPNDIVLDAFCGSGTTLAAAQSLGRRWIGMDISLTACRLSAKRLQCACKLKQCERLRTAGKGISAHDSSRNNAPLHKKSSRA